MEVVVSNVSVLIKAVSSPPTTALCPTPFLNRHTFPLAWYPFRRRCLLLDYRPFTHHLDYRCLLEILSSLLSRFRWRQTKTSCWRKDRINDRDCAYNWAKTRWKYNPLQLGHGAANSTHKHWSYYIRVRYSDELGRCVCGHRVHSPSHALIFTLDQRLNRTYYRPYRA